MAVPRASGDAVPRCGPVLLPPFEGRLKGKRLLPPVIVTPSCGLPCQHGIEHRGNELLLGFGQLGDGIELLFDT
jgi:hypothetical protein